MSWCCTAWDLARATGQSFSVSEADAVACLGFADSISEPEQAESRKGLYGPEVEVPPDAPVLYRLLGASGRHPAWRSPIPTATSSSATTSSQPGPDIEVAGERAGDGPTFILVPGAWMGAWVWQDIVTRLQAAGHRARTLTLTGLQPGTARGDVAAVSLQRHVDDVVGELERENLHDVVLVAHSYSGVVVGQVADQAPQRVRRCTHVAALLPRDRRSLLADWGDDEELRAQERQQVLDDGPVWAPPPPSALAEITDLDPDARRWLSEGFVDHPWRTVLDPVRLSRPVTEQPLTFIATAPPGEDSLADLPPELASGMSGQWWLRTFTSGHWPMTSASAQLQQLPVEEFLT